MSAYTEEEIRENINYYKEQMRPATTEQYNLQSGQSNQGVKRNLKEIRETLIFWQDELEKYQNENSGSGLFSASYKRRGN